VLRRSAAFAVAYAVLAIAVAAGGLTRVDQWAIDHAMPGAAFRAGKPSLRHALVPLVYTHWRNGFQDAANVAALPGWAAASVLVFGVCCATLHRRGERRAAAAWAAALVAGDAVEGLCKEVLARPRLHAGDVPLVAFDSSFPSGHTLRVVLIGALVAATWRRSRVAAWTWTAAAVALIELAGWHTPSDLAGGLLLAAVLLGAVTAASAASRRSSSSSAPSVAGSPRASRPSRPSRAGRPSAREP
jgi:membrane-associated phospholipid phosphatase